MDDVGRGLDSQISRALAGDSRDIDWALERIYENYERELFEIASAMLRSDEDAEDAVQEALADLYKRVKDGAWVTEKGSVRSLLRDVVHNKAVDIIRKRKCRSDFLETERKEQANALEMSTDDTLDLLEAPHGVTSFNKFVKSLTEKEKPIAEYLGDYLLRHGKLPAVKKIVDDVGGSVESVKTIRKRLWPKMKKWLAKADIYEE